MRVFVLGDAFKPGPYNLSSLSSITHAIFAAGGISDIGSLRNIQLKRAGKLVKTLDLYDLLINGDASNDELLQSGDVIFIAPVGETVSIEGEVRRPAIYELVAGETFSDVVKMAGGLLPSAYAKSSIVERYNTNGLRSVININFTDNTQIKMKARAGDSINIMKAANMFSKSVTLIGAVTRPGKYQWFEGQKLTDILPAVDSHISYNADLNYTLIVREIDVARRIELHQVELAKAIGNPSSEDNITLQANDKVLVFSQVDKLSDSKLSLDMLAYTQDDLAEKEKQLVKENHKNKAFWKKYGDKAELSALQAEEQAKIDIINQSIEHIKGGSVEEEVNIEELTIFSRQRLLKPIINKLKRQGGAGQPIQIVEIDGAVKFPGVYPLAVNLRVDDLILAAGGLNESAYLARAELTRNDVGRSLVSKRSISVDLASAMEDSEQDNIILQSKDRLNVHEIPAWSENHVIHLRGEFVFPGRYTVRRGEKLSDIIAKAGGFTEFAHKEASVFTRIKLQQLEKQNLIKLAEDLRVEMASKSLSDENFSQSYSEVQKMLADLTKLQPVGRLVLDLPRVIENNQYDVLLENGDVLYVPTIKNSINVIGQVQVTSSHIYDDRLTAEDYLTQSGGIKKRADADRIYIISANGIIRMMGEANWFTSNANTMQPGDTVVVPLNAEYMDNLTLWTNVTTIMYNTAVAIAAISGI
jgi:polysaccharide export outer membrane protein